MDKKNGNNDDSDKTFFKMKFLGEYYDVVIDWSDESHEYKQMQLFKQIESITGVSNKFLRRLYMFPYTDDASLFLLNPEQEYIWSRGPLPKTFDKKTACDRYIRDGECLVLIYKGLHYFSINNEFIIEYNLTPEHLAHEDTCDYDYCKYIHNRPIFNKIRDIFSNEQLLMKIRSRLYADNIQNILIDFNIGQYNLMMCTQELSEDSMGQMKLYSRTRG